MKKVLLILAIVLLLAAAGLGILWASLNQIVKAGVMRGGAAVTQVDVFLGQADISLFSGRGTLSRLVVGNPVGYFTPSAIRSEVISVQVDPLSVLGDTIHVRWIRLVAPEITFEGVPGENNLSRILAQVKARGGGGVTESTNELPSLAASPSGPRFRIDELTITGARLNLQTPITGPAPVSLDVEDIRLTDLGKGTEGVLAGEVVQRVLDAILGDSTNAVGNMFQRIGEQAIEQAAQNQGPGHPEDRSPDIEAVLPFAREKRAGSRTGPLGGGGQ